MTTHLPEADWTKRADLAALLAALDPEGGGARYVGGAVRDTLLGLDVKDIDVATVHPPGTVVERLAAAGIRTVPTGIAHGTVTALTKAGPVEITTLRRDVSTDGRRATIAFSTDWREDAGRRDFTINALTADPRSLEVHDHFGGLDDLAARRVHFIGDAGTRIREDYLRILRYFRFQARFGSLPADEASERACAALAPGMKALSRERVGWELTNLLALPDPAPTVARMAELGVLGEVLPEVAPDGVARLAALVAQEAAAGIRPAALRRLAALLPRDPARAGDVAARLRLSVAARQRLERAADASDTDDPRGLAYRVGLEAAIDRLLLDGRDIAALAGWTPPQFPLKGGEIVQRGVSAGPDVARILQAVERRWIAEHFPPRARVVALLDDELARR